MSIITKAQYRGQKRTEVLSGMIRIEQGNNQFIVQDIDTGAMIVKGQTPDGFGTAYYDGSGNLLKTENGIRELRYRLDGTAYKISGTLPDGTEADAYSKDGIDVRDAFS